MYYSYDFGHLVEYHEGDWYYIDNHEPLAIRACPRCGRPPTKEGYDPCIGHVKGAKSVCCGHGVHPPILLMEDDN